MQGFNMGRYVPPDLEGTTSGNKIHKKHPLGARASKRNGDGSGGPGSLTVRFEMPFAVWCATCPKPTIIGQGVRFNAQKSRAGSYYTTPIWSFRMRHADCGGEIEVRTDPKNTAYVVVSGGKKRDTGEEGGPGEGQQVIMTDQERQALRANAFASLEKTIEDREQLRHATQRIDDLVEASARHWDDPYAQNQKLRRAFRVGRKEREKDAAATEDLKDRMSLGLDLVPATEEDARRAALVDFAPAGDDDESARKALAKPLFNNEKRRNTNTASTRNSKLRPDKDKLARRKADLASEIMGNTRASQDPFLNGTKANGNGGTTGDAKPPARIPGVKRKRPTVADGNAEPEAEPETAKAAVVSKEPGVSGSLVDYDSD